MHIKTLMVLMGMLALVITACGQGGNGIKEVTPLPQSELNITATPTRTPPVVALADDANPASADEGNTAITPTPKPLDIQLGAGEARLIAQATDVAYQPTPRNEVSFTDRPVNIRFDEFYDGFNLRSGLILSDKLVSLDGVEVMMEGYIAPPLKPKLDFFVLTSIPLSSCPFCSTVADWPDDIALVYLQEEEVVYTPYPVRVTGRMEIGASVDAETGMVSLVRIYADTMETLE